MPSQHSVHLHIALCGRCDMEKGHRKAKRSVYGPSDYITRNRTLCLSMKGCHSNARRVWASHVAYIVVGTVSCRRRLEWGVDVLEVAPPVSVDSTGGGSSRVASKAARSTVRIFKTAKRSSSLNCFARFFKRVRRFSAFFSSFATRFFCSRSIFCSSFKAAMAGMRSSITRSGDVGVMEVLQEVAEVEGTNCDMLLVLAFFSR